MTTAVTASLQFSSAIPTTLASAVGPPPLVPIVSTRVIDPRSASSALCICDHGAAEFEIGSTKSNQFTPFPMDEGR